MFRLTIPDGDCVQGSSVSLVQLYNSFGFDFVDKDARYAETERLLRALVLQLFEKSPIDLN